MIADRINSTGVLRNTIVINDKIIGNWNYGDGWIFSIFCPLVFVVVSDYQKDQILNRSGENLENYLRQLDFAEMTIKQIKKELRLTNEDIAKFFGYKNKASYYHAARRKDIEAGIVEIYNRTVEHITVGGVGKK